MSLNSTKFGFKFPNLDLWHLEVVGPEILHAISNDAVPQFFGMRWSLMYGIIPISDSTPHVFPDVKTDIN